jgi:acyl dehydratase
MHGIFDVGIPSSIGNRDQGRRDLTSSISHGDFRVGTQLPHRYFMIRRADLESYAGSSGDNNPIHLKPEVARQVGLPGVIAHGMYTMALACRIVTDWVGDPGKLVDYSVRFSKPVVVPVGATGARIDVDGVVSEVTPEGLMRIDLTACCGEDRVLGRARVTVRLKP